MRWDEMRWDEMRWDACNNRLLCMRSDELKLKERGNGEGRYD